VSSLTGPRFVSRSKGSRASSIATGERVAMLEKFGVARVEQEARDLSKRIAEATQLDVGFSIQRL
jgi:hypothetical protein